MPANVSDRETVIPGQLLGTGVRCGLNCFKDGDSVYSQVSGIARVDRNDVSVIPSHGSYVPKVEDVVIGVVEEATSANWFVSIGQPYTTLLSFDEVLRDKRDDPARYYNVGDLLSAKIIAVDEVLTSILTRPWKLEEGAVITINPQRVARVVGKKRSMLEMIKEKTGCKIVVGQNGWVWIKGDNERIAIDIIKKVEEEAHTQGLTSRIEKTLNERLRRP